ncbi:MAG: GNAT family N-acetyltransferase [Pseudomonadota bacterium]
MTNIRISIRSANVADLETIVSGNQRMAKETEGKSLDTETLTAGVAGLLSEPERGRYWLAVADEQPVGQIMVTKEWSDWRNGFFWWIQSVYVEPDWRQRGVFRALYQSVKTEALAQHAVGLRLYVEKDNESAIATYISMGMVEPGYRMMEEEFNED